ncbi:unnamed protein product [Brassica napus]|uniref:(rape) hypothetical protein n=1 Tax=Brassica napus TaxID=3708 RepID=A0A816SMA1_BRANA|nr:unnamed protein product [Brassica napus]
MKKTIERYRKYTRDHETSSHNSEIYIQQLKQEASHLITKIELLEFQKRKLLGQELASCSLEELQEIDSQLQISLGKVRARKGKQLLEENVQLHQMVIHLYFRLIYLDILSIDQQEKFRVVDLNLEVQTDLYIGLPERHCK